MNQDQLICVVAGASRGAGKGTALALAEIGATVYVMARSSRFLGTALGIPGTVEDTVDEINKLGGRGIPIICDCSDEQSVRTAFKEIHVLEGHIDLLVNSAWGGHDFEPDGHSPFEDVKIKWKFMFDRGVWNYLLCSSEALPLLRRSSSGMIVNISFWDDDRYTGDPLYDMAKNSMNRLALVLHHELLQDNITAIAISPGYMRTERVTAALEADPSLKEKFGVPAESTRFVGRAIAALVRDSDRKLMSGKVWRAADLSRKYGVVDLDGSQPEPFRLPG